MWSCCALRIWHNCVLRIWSSWVLRIWLSCVLRIWLGCAVRMRFSCLRMWHSCALRMRFSRLRMWHSCALRTAVIWLSCFWRGAKMMSCFRCGCSECSKKAIDDKDLLKPLHVPFDMLDDCERLWSWMFVVVWYVLSVTCVMSSSSQSNGTKWIASIWLRDVYERIMLFQEGLNTLDLYSEFTTVRHNFLSFWDKTSCFVAKRSSN